MPIYSQITDLYVNEKTGSGGNAGTSPKNALQYIGDALSRVASLRRIGVKQPITVHLVQGVYTLSEPLKFDETLYAVTLAGDDNGETVLAGGKKITGWTADTFNGTACLSADLPEKSWKFTDLYVNGERAVLPRFPADGSKLYPEDVENHSTKLGDGSQWFIAKEGDIQNFRNFEDCLISFNHYWIDEHTPIASYDPATRKVVMQYRSRFSIAGGANTSSGLAYVIENVAEMFAKENEWYFDRPNGKIYYIPREGVTAENIEAYAPVASQLVIAEGKNDLAHDVHFRNLTFAYTRGEYASKGWTSVDSEAVLCASDAQSVCNADGVLHFAHARDCSVENCTIRNMGWHGIFFGEETHNLLAEDCIFYDGGMGGVRMSGVAAGGDGKLSCTHNTVTRCRLEKLGRRYMAACGVLIMHASECEVSYCDIGDLYYTGVSVGWVWGYFPSVANHNRILYNHIHDLGQGKLSDMGGVYLLGLQEGTVVRGNIIHDVTSAHYGGWALYTDEGSSYMTLEDNICYNVSENCYHQHYGSMNTVRHNIFANPGKTAVAVSRAEEHLSIIFTGNLFILNGKPAYTLHKRQLDEGTVSASGNFYADGGEAHVDLRGAGTLSLSETQQLHFDEDTAVTEKLTFTTWENLPAVDGFAPLRIPHFGPHCDKA